MLMFEETLLSPEQRLYGSFLEDNINNNFIDNISSVKSDKELKNKSCSCLECNKFLKIIFVSKIKIVYICDCKKDAETKKIKDLIYHELGEKEVLNLTCEKHDNKKFIFYCFDCKENLCSECRHEHNHNNVERLNDIQNIWEKIEEINNEINQRYNYNQNDSQCNSLKLDSSFDDYEKCISIITENEKKFIKFCNIMINYFKDYPTYSQIENLNKIYEYFFSLKIKYKFIPGLNILFGLKFYERNKNKFILKIDEKEIEDNNYLSEKDEIIDGIFIIKEGKKLDNLSYMFYQVSSVISIQDINFLNCSNVKDMNKMDYIFNNCSSLEELHPSRWNSGNFKGNMIYNCPFYKSYYCIGNDKDNLVNENICNIENYYESPNKNSKQLLYHDNVELNKDNKMNKIYYLVKRSLQLIFIFIILFLLLIKINTYDNPVALKKEIWKGYETKVGGYYILYTPLRDDYSKITGDIKLPISLNTNKGKRIAYITLGVLGLNGKINIGIINSKFGWTPYYYDTKLKKMEGFTDYICPEETEIIKFKLELLNSSKILFSLDYFDSNSVILNSFITEIDISHILIIKNNKAKLRFYRYIQLRPNDNNDNQNDGTYMEKGEFKELYIVKKNISESWGIMGKNVEVAWKVSSKHIRLHFNRNKEIFSINHK